MFPMFIRHSLNAALHVHAPDLPLHRRRSKNAHAGCLIRGLIEMRFAKGDEDANQSVLKARFSFSLPRLPLRSISRVYLRVSPRLSHLRLGTRVRPLSPGSTRKQRDVFVLTRLERRHRRLKTFAPL